MSSFQQHNSPEQSEEYKMFLQNIKLWVDHSARVDALNQKIKEERAQIDSITPQITGYMEHNNMTNMVINLQDSKLKYTETSTQGTISLKFLQEALLEFFNGDTVNASNCFNYVKNKRPVKKTVELKRFYK